MKMKMKVRLLASALATAGMLAAVGVNAESTIGVQDSASAVATARLNVRIVVPKIIALRVGTPGTTIDTLIFTSTAAGAAANTNSQQATGANANWDGTTPPVLSASGPFDVSVAAWTNVNNSTLTCAAAGNGGATTAITNAGTNVPVLADIGATAQTGGPNHPGASLDKCGGSGTGGGSTTLANNSLFNGTWRYALNGTMSTYQAGSYGTQITYTAATP